MNFFKKVLGYSNDLSAQLKKAQFEGTLYRVVKDARNIIFPLCKITFLGQQSTRDFTIHFQNTFAGDGKNPQQYAFPLHAGMDLVSFSMNKNGKVNICFEWILDENQKEVEHIGCYMTPDKKDSFKDIICRIIQVIYNDQMVKNHLQLCRELTGIPVYKDPATSQMSSSKKIVPKEGQEFNEMLIIQANRKDNKFVHSASCYEIFDKEKKLIYEPIIVVLRAKSSFQYELQLSNQTGFLFLKEEITPGLTYEINSDDGYIKWLRLQQDKKARVIEVYFGKRDATLSLKFAIMEALYQYNTKKSIKDSIPPQQFSFIKQIDEKPAFSQKQNQRIVKVYKNKEQLQQIGEKNFFYENREAHEGLEKYRMLSQGKIQNLSFASLGQKLETLKISEDNRIQRVDKTKLTNQKNQTINVGDILLHEADTKAMLHGEDGCLYYRDLQKGKIVQEYAPSKKGIQHICPEYKLAETSNYKTFKAASLNTIYQIDPRVPDGVVNMKAYTTSPEFCEMSTDTKGNFAVGSLNGQIRLYDNVGKNANCKFPGLGDPVQHLQSTKDGKWLLATFKTYLLLLPTETQDERSMYHEKVEIQKRPRPIKLQIKMQHLQKCKVNDLKMVHAKFDERLDSNERFIISGFGEYVAIWSLADVVARGDTGNYKFNKVDGKVIQADFKWNDVKKIIMTTDKGILIKENRIIK